MKILVTGASGYIGSQLVPLLLQHQHQIRIVTREASKLQQPWKSTVEIIEGDLRDPAVCKAAVAVTDAVIHLAGLAHVGASMARHQQENYFNTQQLALAAIEAGVKVFVYQSSSKANFPQHSSYGKFKRASEEFLLGLSGFMQVVCLRPGIVYGVGMRNNLRTLLSLLSKPSLPIFITSTNSISMISVEDCCRALSAALNQQQLWHRVWELNDGVRYSLQDLTSQVRSRLQLPMPILYCPWPLVWLAFALLGLVQGRGAGLNTWRALYVEEANMDKAFAQTSGVKPSTNFYQLLPALLGLAL